MKRFYKVLLLVLIVFTTFFLNGCKREGMSGIKNLQQQELYTQKEDKYYVFLYRDGCTGCEEVKPYVLRYIKLAKGREECRKVYGFYLSDEKNKLIYRTNPNPENGQGSYTNKDGKVETGIFFVDDVEKWDELYIGTTPSLISIRVIDGVKKSYFICSGSERIKETLNYELSK